MCYRRTPRFVFPISSNYYLKPFFTVVDDSQFLCKTITAKNYTNGKLLVRNFTVALTWILYIHRIFQPKSKIIKCTQNP